MQFLENDLETIIFNTENERLRERGLPIYGKKKRQLKIGNYGICDLISWKRIGNTIYIQLYELKKDFVDITTFLQALRYFTGIKHYFQNRYSYAEVDIILIGRTVEKGSFIYLPDACFKLKIITYDFDFDGINFELHRNYVLTNPGF